MKWTGNGILPSLSAEEPRQRRGWPACSPAGCRRCSCLGSGRPGSWFSSRTSSPFLSTSRRLSSASRSGSSAAGADPRYRPFLPASRSWIYHSSSRGLTSDSTLVFTPKLTAESLNPGGAPDTMLSRSRHTEQQPWISLPRAASDATSSSREWGQRISGSTIKLKASLVNVPKGKI